MNCDTHHADLLSALSIRRQFDIAVKNVSEGHIVKNMVPFAIFRRKTKNHRLTLNFDLSNLSSQTMVFG